MSVNDKITPREKDYSQWYMDVIRAADLAEQSPVRGSMVIKPYGYAIWENIQKILDARIKETGHKNAYFPLFIPKSFLSKEAKHVEGFATECAVVTHYRLKAENGEMVVDPEAKLEEELIVRPTSETIIYNTFANWVESWRDLPLLINQWANVVRWEMRTRPFLRTSEFLWQEGHTAHATKEEAEAEQIKMLKEYYAFAKDYLALSPVAGEKSESERFAGADSTGTIECLMQDGKALQAGTSHHLGQNFSKAFDITFIDQDQERKYVWQTSWGMSTRIMGALVMTHSDDKGLVLPPNIAPIKVVVVPIWKNDEEKTKVEAYIHELKGMLPEASEIDFRDYITPGEKFYEWEKKGVPVRIEVGPRDEASRNVVLVRRDTGEKQVIASDALSETIKTLLTTIQEDLFKKANDYRISHTTEVSSYDEFKKVLEEKGGFIMAFWDGTPETEAKIKEETGATIRCIPYEIEEKEGNCVYTNKPTKWQALFAKAY